MYTTPQGSGLNDVPDLPPANPLPTSTATTIPFAEVSPIPLPSDEEEDKIY